MIEGEKLADKIKALKMKYCNIWVEKPEGDSFEGFHGYMEMMLAEAIKYGFEQGESFGRYERYAENVVNDCLIKPENIRAWKEQLESIKKDTDTTNPAWKSYWLLELIAEMLLYKG